jgi:hypothetical protein
LVVLINVQAFYITANRGLLIVVNNPYIAVVILIGTGLLALWGWSMWHGSRVIAVACCIPQQALVLMGATGVVIAGLEQSYADGTVHLRWFIWADQIYLVLLAIFHTCALSKARRWG